MGPPNTDGFTMAIVLGIIFAGLIIVFGPPFVVYVLLWLAEPRFGPYDPKLWWAAVQAGWTGVCLCLYMMNR